MACSGHGLVQLYAASSALAVQSTAMCTHMILTLKLGRKVALLLSQTCCLEQVDSTFQRLERIGEYIDDTEDLINIQLDYARNKLIRFEAGPNWSGYGCITCGAAVRL